jgi:spore coat polysaccharide biosynthesis protein SpsF
MGRPAVSVGVIVQARMGSTRLPGKILEPIAGKPLLGHILARMDCLRSAATVVIATGTAPRDDVVADFCAGLRINCFRGSEEDVLARYRECARQWGFEHIVRLTGDNPFTDIEELDRLIEFHIAGGYDFSCSFEDLPIGVGAEIFTFDALERSFRDGDAPPHREHVDEYILENRELFRIGHLSIPVKKRHPDARLTVDTPEDLARVRFIAERASGAWPTTEEAIELCSRFA